MACTASKVSDLRTRILGGVGGVEAVVPGDVVSGTLDSEGSTDTGVELEVDSESRTSEDAGLDLEGSIVEEGVELEDFVEK